MTAPNSDPIRTDLTVVLPAYNEEGNIGPVVIEAVSFLDREGIDYEIVVVDDGSNDGTRAELGSLERRVPRLRALLHPTNQGYGAALRSGIRAARGGHVLLSDGDGQFCVGDLAALWPYRKSADVVLGYRNPRNDPRSRRVAGWLYNRIFVRLALGGSFRDVNCGFKLFSREILEGMELHSTGALFSAELLTRARLEGASFVEVGVRHFPRNSGAATGLLPRVVLKMLAEAVRLRRGILTASGGRDPSLRTEPDAVESASA